MQDDFSSDVDWHIDQLYIWEDIPDSLRALAEPTDPNEAESVFVWSRALRAIRLLEGTGDGF